MIRTGKPRCRLIVTTILGCAFLFAALTGATAVLAQSTDVNCNKCVDTKDIANRAVTKKKIAKNAVTSNRIKNGAVTGAKLAADAVTTDKIATNAVGASEIATDAVGSSEIATNAVGASEIAADAVGSSEIAADAVGSSEIADDSLTGDDLANEPGIEFNDVGGIGANTFLAVDPSWSTIRTLNLNIPSGGGFVFCSCSGFVLISDVSFAGRVHVGVDDDNDNNTDPPGYVLYEPQSGHVGLDQAIPLTAQRTFSPVVSGDTTYACTGQLSTGDFLDMQFFVNSFACMFFPTRY